MSDLTVSEPIAQRARTSARAPVRRLLPGAAAFVTVGALGAAEGGYFPTSWGWSASMLGWLAAVALLFAPRLPLARRELLFCGGLLAVAGWAALSALWSQSIPRTALEVERGLVYPAAALALLALAHRRRVAQVLGGTLAAIALVSTYALATRLLPERFAPSSDSVAGYRLSEPIGYWNGLGIWSALGLLLALGFVARSPRPATRALASAALVVLAPTLYFTFSRGGWLALAGGLAAAVALDPRRVQFIAAGVTAAPAALAVWLGSRSDTLTSIQPTPGLAVDDGRRLAIWILALALLAAAAGAGLALAERRLVLPTLARRAWGLSLALGGVVLLVAVFVRLGGPVEAVRDVHRGFTAPPPVLQRSFNERLFNLSSSGRNLQWRVAWDTFTAHPLLGTGAGTYEQRWLVQRTVAGKVRDGHSLYLEGLAEGGVFGLALLVGTLSLPIAAAVRRRRGRLVPAAFGAYVAFLLHAGVDWDWELPGVTVAGLFAGCALLLAARDDAGLPPTGRRLRLIAIAASVALGAAAFVGLLGNRALAEGRAAALAAQWERSADRSRDAARFAPWAAEPWRRIALAQPTAALARPYFLKAIAKDRWNWELWLELAWASSGADRQRAVAEASRLNPLSPEIADYRARLATERKTASSS